MKSVSNRNFRYTVPNHKNLGETNDYSFRCTRKIKGFLSLVTLLALLSTGADGTNVSPNLSSVPTRKQSSFGLNTWLRIENSTHDGYK